MTLADVLRILRAHEAELRALGIARLSVFGSTARGEAGPDSDVDIVVEVAPPDRWTFLDRARAQRRLSEALQSEVDLIREPATRKPSLQAEIDRDRVVAF